MGLQLNHISDYVDEKIFENYMATFYIFVHVIYWLFVEVMPETLSNAWPYS